VEIVKEQEIPEIATAVDRVQAAGKPKTVQPDITVPVVLVQLELVTQAGIVTETLTINTPATVRTTVPKTTTVMIVQTALAPVEITQLLELKIQSAVQTVLTMTVTEILTIMIPTAVIPMG